LRSLTDALPNLQAKMQEWIANGCRLAWLIDPAGKQVFIYRADGSVTTQQGFETPLSGEDVLPGLVLDLQDLLT
jgi:Uma2 family endonuclease